jgi:hypothetical protein
MARRGYTNPEMLADLSATAAETFSSALQQTLDSNAYPVLEGKPLSAIFIKFVHGRLNRFQGSPIVVAEELGIRAINGGDMQFLNHRRRFKDLPQDVIDRYQGIANRLAHTALGSGLRVAGSFPAEAAQVDYAEYKSNGTHREVKTLDYEPVKDMIAAAQDFAEDALEYTELVDFKRSLIPLGPAVPMGPRERVIYSSGWQLHPGVRNITHHFGIDPSVPDLPLNGHESSAFLQAYLGIMREEYEKRWTRYKTIEEMGGYEIHHDTLREGMAPYERTIERVKKVLEGEKS